MLVINRSDLKVWVNRFYAKLTSRIWKEIKEKNFKYIFIKRFIWPNSYIYFCNMCGKHKNSIFFKKVQFWWHKNILLRHKLIAKNHTFSLKNQLHHGQKKWKKGYFFSKFCALWTLIKGSSINYVVASPPQHETNTNKANLLSPAP